MSDSKGGDLRVYVQNEKTLMTASNYNEIDGLVFSSIIYNSFESESVIWTQSELENGVDLKTFAGKLVQAANCDSDVVKTADRLALLQAVSESPRYKNCIVTNMATCKASRIWDAGRVSTISEQSQWAAMTINIEDGSGTSVIAMRGTDATVLGWTEDVELGYESFGTTAQALSKEYLSACNAERIALAGHSKGGSDVVAAYMMCDPEIRDRVFQINNYDGPGNNFWFNNIYKDGYRELERKLYNYYPELSVIGQLLSDNPGEHYYCKADTKGHIEDKGILGQHDTYAWEFCDKGTLNNSEQGMISKVLNRIMDRSLRNFSNSESYYALQALIQLGIPELIAEEEAKKSPVKIEYSNWQDALINVIQGTYISIQQMWCACKLLFSLVNELIYEGYASVTFPFPEEADFISSIRDICSDFFRNYKDEADRIWDEFIKGASEFIFPGFRTEDSIRSSTLYCFGNNKQGVYADNVLLLGQFLVDLEKLQACARRIDEIRHAINKLDAEIDLIGSDISPLATGKLTESCKEVCTELELMAEKIGDFKSALCLITQAYRATENSILCEL